VWGMERKNKSLRGNRGRRHKARQRKHLRKETEKGWISQAGYVNNARWGKKGKKTIRMYKGPREVKDQWRVKLPGGDEGRPMSSKRVTDQKRRKMAYA